MLTNSANFTTHIESFCKNISELDELFYPHYLEISDHKRHSIPLNPDYLEYRRLEDCGQLLFIALRRNGKLVGYSNNFIKRALHYNVLTVSNDLFYVSPEARGYNTLAGKMLVAHVTSEATRRGAKVITMGHKVARSKHMRKLLTDSGFEPFEAHYVIWI